MQPGAERSALAQLRQAGQRDWENGNALTWMLDHWCRAHGIDSAALFERDGDDWCLLRATSSGDAAELDPRSAPTRELPGGLTLALGGDDAATSEAKAHGELDLLLTTGALLYRLHDRFKEQVFQENYKAVTLEALYDVGLSVASTLDLDELVDEILPRAVALLDARRGALYLREGASFALQGTIGGDARASIAADDPGVVALLAGNTDPDLRLIEGSSFPVVVPIGHAPDCRGLLAIADKESRTGVGPFSDADRRALSMFAAQAAIALENAHLHRQALEKERLEREMELAAEIQRGILPASMPSSPRLDVLGWSRPTRQVGGDYYGSLALAGGRIGLVVADVTGKGMPAALLVSTLHSAIHLLLDSNAPGAEMVAKLNQHITESSGANKFITMILAEIDPDGDRLGYLNAGHNPGLVVRASGVVDRLEPSGLPLGLLPHSTYRYEDTTLDAGDLVCLYSDGITECESPDEEEFGEQRLIEHVTEHRTDPLPELLSSLEAELTRFAAARPQGDDQTVVLLRRR